MIRSGTISREMINPRFIWVWLICISVFSSASGQTSGPYLIQFDKQLYSAGETAWFAIFYTDSTGVESPREVIHFELLSPKNEKIIQGKLPMDQRLAQGYLKLPTSLEDGYYRLRAFTIQSIREGGYYIYADIPVYSEWNENLTVYKFEEVQVNEEEESEKVKPDRNSRVFSRRDSVKISSLLSDVDQDHQFAFWVEPREFSSFNPIQYVNKKIEDPVETQSSILVEDSLYFEALLLDRSTDEPITSPLISIFSGKRKRFFRAKAQEGWMQLKIPDFEGDATLQVFNLNPYQDAVSELRTRQWSINEGYYNPTKPPITADVAEYLIKAKQRRKVNDLFGQLKNGDLIGFADTSMAIPDLQYKMDEYQYISDLENFIFEAIPGARILTQEDGSPSIRLYNPERRSVFIDRPWYIVDGYLTSREDEVLAIPFKDIDEIKLYVDTNTIKKYFEYFMWRNGILEVKTKDVKYLRSLKTDPNFVDFAGFQTTEEFSESLRFENGNTPDFRTTIHWMTGNWTSENASFTLSDDTGRFRYHLVAVSDSGEIIRKEGEFEVR